MQLDTQANVIQALDSKRVDAAAVDLSTVQWLAKRQPDRYVDAGKKWYSMLYSAAVRQGDLDWLQFVNTTFDVAMHGHLQRDLRHCAQGLFRDDSRRCANRASRPSDAPICQRSGETSPEPPRPRAG